ncbi:MAG: lysophospholipase [Longimicrobiales bacterium]
MSVITRSQGCFRGVRGLRLQYRSWEPPSSRGTLLLVHGLSDHSARYNSFAERLADARVGTFALDLRGHGHSEGRRGHVSSFDVFLQDLERFRREVQGLIPAGQPTVLLGHSMGGLIALRYLQEYEPALTGAVLVSPWLGTALSVPRWKITLGLTLGRLLPAVPLRAHIPAERLSHDPAVAQQWRHDPLVHDRITPRLFSETAHAMGQVFQRSDRIRLPLLFLLGGADEVVDTRRAMTLARSLKAPSVSIRVYPRQYHELLNEAAAERELVLGDLREWLDARM